MKIMFAVALALTAGAAMLVSPVMAKEMKTIKIATEGAYKPYNFKDSAGNLIGFEIDLANDLCQRMQAKCEIVEQAWDGIIPSLMAGKYDAIMAGMSVTAARQKKIMFSRGYLADGAGFVILKTSPLAGFSVALTHVNLDVVDADEKAVMDKIIATFSGKTIGVQTATTHEKFLRAQMGKDVDIRSYDTQDNLDLDLQSGRIDAALASMDYWAPLLSSAKGAAFKQVGPELSGGEFGAGVGVGTRKEDSALADMFSKAITAAVKDGTCKKIAVKWFGFDNCAIVK